MPIRHEVMFVFQKKKHFVFYDKGSVNSLLKVIHH